MNGWSVMVIAAAVIVTVYLISQYFSKEHMDISILTQNNRVIVKKGVDYPRGESVWCLVSCNPNGQASYLVRVISTGEECGSVVVNENFYYLSIIHVSAKQMDELTSQRMASFSTQKRRM